MQHCLHSTSWQGTCNLALPLSRRQPAHAVTCRLSSGPVSRSTCPRPLGLHSRTRQRQAGELAKQHNVSGRSTCSAYCTPLGADSRDTQRLMYLLQYPWLSLEGTAPTTAIHQPSLTSWPTISWNLCLVCLFDSGQQLHNCWIGTTLQTVLRVVIIDTS